MQDGALSLSSGYVSVPGNFTLTEDVI